MNERPNLDRLLLPRMRAEPEGVELLIPESSAPLPRWQTVPLDAKFPVTPAAKGEVTFVTTRISEPTYRSSQHENFDLTDPYNRTIKTEYQALCDPYLKHWFAKPYVRKQLLEQNLLTPSGNVPCTVRDFNNYRNFLRRQALMKNKEPETCARAAEKRKMILQKTKRKAELVSVEVKCKGLKAQQMLKEAEEEKQRQFWKKQAAESEREQKRLEEEQKTRSELMKARKAKWAEKQEEIRKREETLRKIWENKVVQFETEAKEKLDNLGLIKQQRQCLLDRKRRVKWQQKYEHQRRVLEETMRQYERVEAETEIRKKLYEEKMMKVGVKNPAAMSMDIQTRLEGTERKTDVDEAMNATGMSLAMQEMLYSFGMTEEARLLMSTKCSQGYSNVLDKLIGSAVRKREIENSSVLGQQQYILSKIIHLMVRRLKEAYPGERQGQITLESADKNQDEAAGIKRLFPGVDDTQETEKAVYMTMCATLDMDRQITMEKNAAEDMLRQREEIANLFANHLRLTEAEVRQVEADLDQHLEYLQMEPRTFDQEKEILELFLKFACHEPILKPEHTYDIQQNDYGQLPMVLENPSALSYPGYCSCQTDDCRHNNFGKYSRMSSVSCHKNAESEEDYKRSGDEDDHAALIDKKLTDVGCELKEGVLSYDENAQQSLALLDNELCATPVEESSRMSALTETSSQKYMDNNHGNFQDINVELATVEYTNESKNTKQQRSETNDEPSDLITNPKDASPETTKSYSDNSHKNVSLDTSQFTTFTDKAQNEEKCETSNKDSILSNASKFSSLSKTTARETCQARAEAITQFSAVNPSKSLHPCEAEQSTVSPIDQTSLERERDHAAETEISQMSNEDDTAALLIDTTNELENDVTDRCHTYSKIFSTEDIEEGMSYTGRPCSSKIGESNYRSCLEEPKTTEEAETLADGAFTHSPKDDIIAVSARFLMKAQQRELIQGVGFSPSKIHHVIAVSLSHLWRPGPNEDMHVFGEWLDSSDVARAVDSLITNVKIMRFPQTLLHNIASAIVTSLLHNFTESTRCVHEGIIKSVVRQFFEDLKKDQVSLRILENVLLEVYQVYAEYVELDHSFTCTLFLYETLSIAEELLSMGKVVNEDFVTNIIDYERLPSEIQDKLLCNPWRVLLHQAKVSIQLSVLTSGDQKRLKTLLVTCGKMLTETDTGENIAESIKLIHSQLKDESLKQKVTVTVSANVVAALLNTVEDKRITNMTLLPGAVKSHSGVMSSKLGQDTTGEALVLLILDSLVKDLGEDTLDRDCLGHIAASLGEVFTQTYKYQKDALEGDGLAGGLECMTSRFRCKSLDFTDTCKIISAILRPYLAFILTEDADLGSRVKLGDRLPVDEYLLSSLFSFIAEVFVTFVSGVIAKMRLCGVGTDLQDDHLVLCVWQSMASLAQEANTLLTDQNEKYQSEPSKVAMTYSFTIEGFVATFVSKDDNTNSSKLPGCGIKVKVENSSPRNDHDGKDLSSTFLTAILRQLPEPGYVPVSDINIRNQSRKCEPEMFAASKIATADHPAGHDVGSSAQKEIILASRQIWESLVTKEALQTMNVKMADHVACAVFVMDRFVTSLCNKMCALRNELKKGSISPADITSFLATSYSPTPVKITLDAETAVTIATQVFLEFKNLQRSASTLCRLIENLTRIHHRQTGMKGHASNILSVVRATELTLLLKELVIFTLNAITWLLSGTCSSQSPAPLDTQESANVTQITEPAYDIIKDEIEVVRNWTDREKTAKSRWTPRNVAGTDEDSILAVPVKIRDKVFSYIKDVTELARTKPGNDNIDETASPNELIAFIINKVLDSVTNLAEAGTFPFFRINDLLRNNRLAKVERTGDISHDDGNKSGIMRRSKIKDPIIKLEQAETKDLLTQLIQIITGIDIILKQQLNMAVTVNESYDILLKASALMSAKLSKVKNNLSRMNVILSNIQEVDTSMLDRLKTNDPLSVKSVGNKSGDLSSSAPIISTESRKADDKKMSISLYIANLFTNMTDVQRTNESTYVYQMGVVTEILKACYSLVVNYLSCDKSTKSSGDFNLVSALLMEVITNELYIRMDELQKARTKELDKGTNYPYLFSRLYTIPDPWGPYYSDVAVRARQLADTVKMSSVISKKYHKLSAVSSLISSMQDSFSGEKSLDEEEDSSALCEVGIPAPPAENDPKYPIDKKGQARVVAWRRKIKDSSVVHSADNTVKTWIKKDAKSTQKLPLFKKETRSNSLEDHRKDIHRVTSDNAGKTKGNNHRVDSQGNSLQKSLQRSSSADHLGNNFNKSLKKPLVSSFIHKGVTEGALVKQQIKRRPDENKEKLNQIKSKTSWKINETATEKHISRLNRANSIHRRENKLTPRSTTVLSRTVHIIHHAYAVKPDSQPSTIPEEMSETLQPSLVEPDKSQNESKRDELACSQQEDLRAQSWPVHIYLLISLLASEMPNEAKVISRCFDRGTISTLGTDELVDILSVLDLVMIELGQGNEAEATRLLEGQGCKDKVSQRAAEVINNLLQSIKNSLISDEQIQDKLADIGQNCKDVNIQEIRMELTTRLTNMAERVKQGCKGQNLFSGHVHEVLMTIRQATETSQETSARHREKNQDGDSYYRDGDNTSDGYSCESPTPSCNTVEHSLSVSDDDSNDDKCIISSSWTILSSCPSLSSSRSSNAVQMIQDESANESGEDPNISSCNSSSGGTAKKCERRRLSHRNSKNESPCDNNEVQHAGRSLRTYNVRDSKEHGHHSETLSRVDNKIYHNNDSQLLERDSNVKLDLKKSGERKLSSRGSEAGEDKDLQHCPGRSTKTDSAHTWTEHRSVCGDGQFSEESSCTNPPKTSPCSSVRSSSDFNETARSDSISPVSSAATPNSKHGDTWTNTACSQLNNNLDREEHVSTDPASELEKTGKNNAVQDIKDTSGHNSDDLGDTQDLSKKCNHSETGTFEIAADTDGSEHESEPGKDGYDSEHDSTDQDDGKDEYNSEHDSAEKNPGKDGYNSEDGCAEEEHSNSELGPAKEDHDHNSGYDTEHGSAKEDHYHNSGYDTEHGSAKEGLEKVSYDSEHDSAEGDLDNQEFKSENDMSASESEEDDHCDSNKTDTNNFMDMGGGGDIGGGMVGGGQK